ncbi:hypothetical protein AAVH_11536 [Aphelenchoides avenae]|nr:hypothetical protein AAVH_11536 [Aphelenchus avenae]
MRSITVAILVVAMLAFAYANDVRAKTQNGEDPQHHNVADASRAPRVRRWGRYGGWGGGYGGGWRGGWGGGYGGGWRGGWGGGYGGYGYGWGR